MDHYEVNTSLRLHKRQHITITNFKALGFRYKANYVSFAKPGYDPFLWLPNPRLALSNDGANFPHVVVFSRFLSGISRPVGHTTILGISSTFRILLALT